MNYRGLFATDLDGTLLDDEGKLPSSNQRALARAAAAGVLVVIATGRRRSTFRSVRERLDGLPFRVSLSNGAVILAADNHRVASVRSVAWAGLDALAARRSPEVRTLVAITVPPEPAAGEPQEPDAVIVERDGTMQFVGALADPATWTPADAELVRTRELVHVALVADSREDAEGLIRLVRDCYGDGPAVHTARAPRTLGILTEVVAAGGKGNAVRDLAAAFGIAAEATAAVGDEMNDEALLDAARYRYTVGGSPLAARRSDAVEVASANDGAVAEALDRFLAELDPGAA